jgi:hypothetical protein
MQATEDAGNNDHTKRSSSNNNNKHDTQQPQAQITEAQEHRASQKVHRAHIQSEKDKKAAVTAVAIGVRSRKEIHASIWMIGKPVASLESRPTALSYSATHKRRVWTKAEHTLLKDYLQAAV